MVARFPQLSSNGAERPSGLSLSDFADVVHAVRDLPGTWSVDRDVNDRGHTSVSIVQESVSDEDTVIFLLCYEGGRYRTGFGQGEFYADLGVYEGVDGAIMAMRSAVKGSAEMANWMEDLHFPRATAQ